MHASAHLRLSVAAIRAALRRTGQAQIRIRGGSMRPLLQEGALVRVRALSAPRLRAGAVVAVDLGSAVAVHIVVSASRDRVVTHGLASAWPDRPCELSSVLGEVDALTLPAASGTWLPMPKQLGAFLLAALAVRCRLRQMKRIFADDPLAALAHWGKARLPPHARCRPEVRI